MRSIARIWHKISNAWYYWKCRLFRPFNTVRVSTLPPTWVDRDELLLHAAFQVLVDYVEKESPFDIIDWGSSEENTHVRREIEELYRWWTKVRPGRVEPIDKVEAPDLFSPRNPDDPRQIAWKTACEEQWRLEESWYTEDQDMLHRLVNIRSYLWT